MGGLPSLGVMVAVVLGIAGTGMIIKAFNLFLSLGQGNRRLEEVVGRELGLTDMDLSKPFADRVIRPSARKMLTAAGRLMPQRRVEEIDKKLVAAGRPYDLSGLDFLGLRVIVGVGLGGLAWLMTQRFGIGYLQVLLVVLVGVIVGTYLPNFWLRGKISSRRAEISRALPDVLDSLSVCVDAGLGFDGAVAQTCEKFDNALSDELYIVSTEIRMGVDRERALRNLAERVDVQDVSSWVAIIIQSQELGVSMAGALRAQAEQSRQRRIQRAEEQAQTLSVKMLFPMIFLIFPAILLVVLGPAIPIFIELFGTVLSPGA